MVGDPRETERARYLQASIRTFLSHFRTRNHSVIPLSRNGSISFLAYIFYEEKLKHQDQAPFSDLKQRFRETPRETEQAPNQQGDLYAIVLS